MQVVIKRQAKSFVLNPNTEISLANGESTKTWYSSEIDLSYYSTFMSLFKTAGRSDSAQVVCTPVFSDGNGNWVEATSLANTINTDTSVVRLITNTFPKLMKYKFVLTGTGPCGFTNFICEVVAKS